MGWHRTGSTQLPINAPIFLSNSTSSDGAEARKVGGSTSKINTISRSSTARSENKIYTLSKGKLIPVNDTDKNKSTSNIASRSKLNTHTTSNSSLNNNESSSKADPKAKPSKKTNQAVWRGGGAVTNKEIPQAHKQDTKKFDYLKKKGSELIKSTAKVSIEDEPELGAEKAIIKVLKPNAIEPARRIIAIELPKIRYISDDITEEFVKDDYNSPIIRTRFIDGIKETHI